jgi:hypothetical protein
MTNRSRSVVVALLLLVSATEFAVRGPLRLLHGMGWNDFLSPYIQSKAWVHGADPYSAQSLINFWPPDNQRPPFVDREAASGVLEAKRGIPSPYPVSSLVVLAPFSFLPWPVALITWMLVGIAGMALSALALLSICRCAINEVRAQLFLAVVLALAPLHTGIGTANPALLVVSLTVVTVWAERKGRNKTAGILLAFALCVKPTVAGALLFYYLVRGRWKVFGIACAAAAAIGILGVSRLALAGVPWLASYTESTRKMFSPGSLDDFARADGIRFNMINAQVLFYSLLKSAPLADRLARMLGASLLGVWIWLCYRRRRPVELLEISAISVLSLISVYHRFYDAALLIWPLAWGLLVARKRGIQIGVLAMIAPFFVPGPALFGDLALAGRIPSSVTGSWWWSGIVLSHEVWDLILLAILLLYWMAREPSEESPPVFQEVAAGITPGSARPDLLDQLC